MPVLLQAGQQPPASNDFPAHARGGNTAVAPQQMQLVPQAADITAVLPLPDVGLKEANDTELLGVSSAHYQQADHSERRGLASAEQPRLAKQLQNRHFASALQVAQMRAGQAPQADQSCSMQKIGPANELAGCNLVASCEPLPSLGAKETAMFWCSSQECAVQVEAEDGYQLSEREHAGLRSSTSADDFLHWLENTF
ncbi:hypothetical protein MMC07_000395 [Pseudocyphellaria aurata]|nr:hypothetical protein [Pseudocyphellaria aurata]